MAYIKNWKLPPFMHKLDSVVVNYPDDTIPFESYHIDPSDFTLNNKKYVLVEIVHLVDNESIHINKNYMEIKTQTGNIVYVRIYRIDDNKFCIEHTICGLNKNDPINVYMCPVILHLKKFYSVFIAMLEQEKETLTGMPYDENDPFIKATLELFKL